VNWINLFRSVQLCSVRPFEDAFGEELLLVASNSQIKFYLLKTHHISMQQVAKQLMSRANKAQKSTYSDPKTTS